MIHVEHIKIETAKPFAEVKAALEELVPPLDPTIPEALRQGDMGRAKEALQRGPELAIYSARDHGGLLRIAGLARKAVQYELGNALTATRMTQHRLPASLYAPPPTDVATRQPRAVVSNSGTACRCGESSP
jgi:hypothetical protein